MHREKIEKFISEEGIYNYLIVYFYLNLLKKSRYIDHLIKRHKVKTVLS